MKGQEFNDWKKQVFSRLNRVQKQIGETDFKKHNLDFICKALNRISPELKEVEKFDNLKLSVDETLNTIPQEKICKTTLKPYHKKIKTLKHQLKQDFKLIPTGHHSIKWMIIGVGFGIPYSCFISSLLGIFVGLGLGIGIGTYLDKKAEKENKVY